MLKKLHEGVFVNSSHHTNINKSGNEILVYVLADDLKCKYMCLFLYKYPARNTCKTRTGSFFFLEEKKNKICTIRWILS